jgi:branched-chain amino acid transport system permease protein
MHTLIQGVILGVLTGGVYALMASGQTLIFGVMKVINLAQGAFVIASAYLAFTLFTQFGIDPLVAVLITTPLMFGIGVVGHWIFLRPLRSEDAVELSILITFALALLVEGILSITYHTTYRSINTSYANRAFDIGGFSVSAVRLYGFIVSCALLILLYVILQKTRFGRAIRATVQNPQSATLLGVDSNRVKAYGFGLGIATAAASGSIYGLLFPFNSGSHYDLISRLLSVVVLGGLGSIGGAVLAGVIIGVVSSVAAVTWSPTWSEMTFFFLYCSYVRKECSVELSEVHCENNQQRRKPILYSYWSFSWWRFRSCPYRDAAAIPSALDMEHDVLHGAIRRDVGVVESDRRLRGISVLGPCSILWNWRLRNGIDFQEY